MQLYVHTLDNPATQEIRNPGDVFVLVGMRVQGSYGPWGFNTRMHTPGATVLYGDGSNVESVLVGLIERDFSKLEWIYQQFYAIKKSICPKKPIPNWLDTGAVLEGKSLPSVFASLNIQDYLLFCSLTALAQAEPHTPLILNQPENGLPPFMIKGLVRAAQERSKLNGIRVGFISYSPVLLNEFDKIPDCVWVGEPGPEGKVRNLSSLYCPEWLSNFPIGSVYMEESYVKS